MDNKLVVYLMAALLLSTAAIYLREGIKESSELANNNEGSQPIIQQGEEIEHASGNNISDREGNAGFNMSALTETGFFLAVSAAYIIVAIWLLIKKNSKTPYLVAVVGSLALIVLYVVSRIIALPIVGIQDDIGVMDILSKVLQAGIAIAGIYALRTGIMKPLNKQVAK